MKRIPLFLLASTIVVSSCQNGSPDQIISQTFVHKYGFETTEEDWEAREKDGQVVSVLKNGVKVTTSYEVADSMALQVTHSPTAQSLKKRSPMIRPYF